MARIENHKYSIEQAFRECFYIIPAYQREYVWTDKEVNQLLEDINDQFENDSNQEYFIGMVLVAKKLDSSNLYEVIDGQQRLTTLFLLVCAFWHLFQEQEYQEQGDQKDTGKRAQHLRHLLSDSYTNADGAVKDNLKLELCYENTREIMERLLDREAVLSENVRFGAPQNLVKAYKIVYDYLKDNYDDKGKFWGYLSNKVVFIQIATDVSHALKIFETINDRGIGLNPMDLLKNLLFSHVKIEEFSKLKDEWKKITDMLEEKKQKPLRFLRYFLMSNYLVEKNESDKSNIPEDKIYNWLTDADNAKRCSYKDKPFEFVKKIACNAKHYIDFIEGKGNDGNSNPTMGRLKLMTGSSFSLHYMLLLAVAPLSKSLFDHFAAQLESFLFYCLFTNRVKKLESFCHTSVGALRELSSLSDEGEQKERLNRFVEEYFQKEINDISQKFEEVFKCATFKSFPKYRVRYLLARLTQYVDSAYRGTKIPESLEPYMKLDIEHILPKKPREELLATWSEENEGADYNNYKERFGNLTLLEKPINIVASNDFYAEKKNEYRKSKYYLTSSLVDVADVGQNTSISKINKRLKAFEKWDAAAIDARQLLLMTLAREVWKISFL